MKLFFFVCFIILLYGVSSKLLCPKQCKCDVDNDLKRAICIHGNIVDVNVGVPPYVQVYVLSDNSISKLEDYCFQNMGYKSIIDLDLSNNMIFWIGLHAFSGLESLKYLNISKNRLQAIPSDLFWYNKYLEVLDLSENKFMSFKNESFLFHDNLKILNLRQSQIEFLPELSFKKLPRLEKLDLSNNYMIELQVPVLSSLKALKFLSLDGNNWRCNNKFNELQVWILKNKIEYVTQCTVKMQEKKFEKIMSIVPPNSHETDGKPEDLDELWNLNENSRIKIVNVSVKHTNELETFVTLFNKNFPSLWSLIIGLLLGFLIGMFGTYCWLARLCSCPKLINNSRRLNNEPRSSDVHHHLLRSTNTSIHRETPPVLRRQTLSTSACCRSVSWEAAPLATFRVVPTNIMSSSSANLPQRTDTPPPPYGDCISDQIILNQN